MKESKHILSDELIIGYIDATLPSRQIEMVESILAEDNNAFLRYTILNKAYRGIHDVQLEVTPDQLKERLITELGLSTEKEKAAGSSLGFISSIDSLINTIFAYQPRLAIISAAFIALLMRMMFITDPVRVPVRLYVDDDPQHRKHISELIVSLNIKSNSYQSVKAKKRRGMVVSIKKDTLSITQPLMVSRQVYVFNYDENVLLKDEVSDKENNIVLKDLAKNDSLRVVIETAGMIVYDDWLKME
jgi:hypothetical protein